MKYQHASEISAVLDTETWNKWFITQVSKTKASTFGLHTATILHVVAIVTYIHNIVYLHTRHRNMGPPPKV